MSAARLTPEEAVRRVKACLAEAGYPDALVKDLGRPIDAPADDDRFDSNIGISDFVPVAVAWQAYKAAGLTLPCWACWSKAKKAPRAEAVAMTVDCLNGSCAHPECPARPPVELLRRPA